MGGGLHLTDTDYSFVVNGVVNVYEGRERGFVRHCNIRISVIGNFVHDLLTNYQIRAVQEVMKLLKFTKTTNYVAINDTCHI